MIPASLRRWAARLLVAAVFAMNVQSAIAFIVSPVKYTSGFELSGTAGLFLVQAMGILFLIWNATYPPVILHPGRHRLLFIVVIAQQVIGLGGEGWLLAGLPGSHPALAATTARFIYFDTLGLVALTAAFFLAREASSRRG